MHLLDIDILQIYKIIFGGLLKIEKFCKLFFIADSNDSFAFDGTTFHSSTEYGHPDSFSSLSSSKNGDSIARYQNNGNWGP